MRIILLGLVMATLVGCSSWGFPGVYRINVEQGNIVTQEMVEQLKPGMTRQQVRFVLGTPLIEDTFNRDRWDYIYMLRNGNNTLQDNRLTVYFEGDIMQSFSTNIEPGATADAGDAGNEDQS